MMFILFVEVKTNILKNRQIKKVKSNPSKIIETKQLFLMIRCVVNNHKKLTSSLPDRDIRTSIFTISVKVGMIYPKTR